LKKSERLNQPKRTQKDRFRKRRKRSPSTRPPREEQVRSIQKRYGVIFYETHSQAKEDSDQLLAKAKEVDQLNIVIKAEGSMDDPELLQYGKVYAGEAWTTIHKRRFEEGWYNELH
jgi:hypothetical protein